MLKIKPRGATKAAMKEGLVLHTKIAVTYTPGSIGTPTTTILKFALKNTGHRRS